mmetsp:Transcript_2889/g.4243  ORF Transcript_2889/g.4243 Transcript_2889/m.4243 type:complete len:1110 (+) Transcript_2889:90-3419(+)
MVLSKGLFSKVLMAAILCRSLSFQPSRNSPSTATNRLRNGIKFTLSPLTALYSSKQSATHFKVVFQKVVRPNASNKDMFLPSLIDYIQTEFQLPQDLPMVYKSTILVDEDGVSDDAYSILELDSPLSRNSDETKMGIEVVGIYTDEDNASQVSLPSMAMVVVKKKNVKEGNNVMMNRLFDESESKIMKAFDNGLDDFIDDRVGLAASNRSKLNRKKKNGIEMDSGEGWSALDSLEEIEGFCKEDGTFEDLFVASTGRSIDDKVQENNNADTDSIVDAVVSNFEPDNQNDKSSKEESIAKHKEKKHDIIPSEDFAVMAAKMAAKKLKKASRKSGGGDFAVESARAAAETVVTKQQQQQHAPVASKEGTKSASEESKGASGDQQEVSMGQSMPMEIPTVGVSPMLKNLGRKGAGSYQVKVSSPETFSKRNKSVDAPIAKEEIEDLQKIQTKRNINLVTDMSDDAKKLSEKEIQTKLDAPASLIDNNVLKQPLKTKTDKEIEEDIIKAAKEIMPGTDLNDPTADMSPEELLKDILKFGDEQEKQEGDGTGFVQGAFSKAKEIISNEEAKEVAYKEVSRISDLDKIASDKPLSAEEELKRIFAAGENIAEKRMTQSSPRMKGQVNTNKSIVTEEYVDDLIGADKSVPGNARSIDDELAELEIRISKTPGEDSEAYGPNALFDIFSGPEVYNPNVDPETSVNWPGAQPGTRTDALLPPQLSEAVKSATFAAKLLSKMIEEDDGDEIKSFFIDGKKISNEQIQKLQRCVDEGVAVGLIEDPARFMKEQARLNILLNELCQQPEERFGEIATFYKDLLLSDNFVILLKENLRSVASSHLEMKRSGKDSSTLEEKHALERSILGKLVKYAQLLLKETQALGAELEANQLEVIRSICNVAMDPKHSTEEDTAEALTDAVKDMKPMLDENFVAYLKYAIAEEEARLARAGLVDDPEHNRWLFVLKIIQEGVYAELAVGVKRYIDHIGYVLRMDTNKERRELLAKLIDVMPSMDVRPFVKVVDNIAASLGQGSKGEFDDTDILGGMTNPILQLRRDVHELLPPERMKTMSKEADEWAARQREKLMERRGVAKQRLEAARDSESYESEIGRRGEVENFTSY